MGILLAPTAGRLTAFAIVGVPLVLFLILGFKTAGSGASADSGYDGGQPQYQQPLYPAATTTEAAPQYTYSPDGSSSTTDTTTDTATDTTAATDLSTDTSTSTASPSPSYTGPAAVVVAAYADIDKQDYQDAYKLGLDQNGTSEATFAQGYSTTKSVTLSITEDAGDTVYVTLTAISTSGVQTSYQGTYTVSGGLITGADLQQVS